MVTNTQDVPIDENDRIITRSKLATCAGAPDRLELALDIFCGRYNRIRAGPLSVPLEQDVP